MSRQSRGTHYEATLSPSALSEWDNAMLSPAKIEERIGKALSEREAKLWRIIGISADRGRLIQLQSD